MKTKSIPVIVLAVASLVVNTAAFSATSNKTNSSVNPVTAVGHATGRVVYGVGHATGKVISGVGHATVGVFKGVAYTTDYVFSGGHPSNMRHPNH